MKKYIFLLLLLLTWTANNVSAISQTDSLKNLLTNELDDKEKIDIYIKLAIVYANTNPDSANFYINKSFEINKDNKIEDIDIYWNLSKYYGDINNSDSCLEYLIIAKNMAKKMKNIEKEILINTALVYQYSENAEYEQSFTLLLDNEKIINESGITKYKTRNYLMLGFCYREYKNIDKAFEYFEKATKTDKDEDVLDDKATAYNELGNLENTKGNHQQAIIYQTLALKIREENNKYVQLMFSYNDIATTYQALLQYDKALEYLNKSLIMSKKYNHLQVAFANYINIASIYMDKKNYYTAKIYIDSSYFIATNIQSKKLYEDLYNGYYLFYKEQNIYDKALEYHELSKLYADSIRNEESDANINKLQIQYESLKKDKEIITANEKLKQKNIIIYTTSIATAIVLFLLIFLYKLFKDKKNALEMLKIQNIEISQKNEEILTQSEEIFIQQKEILNKNQKIQEQNADLEQKNKHITDSILYAKRIQSAVLPTETDINSVFQKYFVFFRPRDIVSGDFYWVRHFKNLKIIAAADCTGHGVPGAFMSMLAIALMNEIVRKEEVIAANEVLEQLRIYIKKSLQQTGKYNESKDGMDIAICVIKDEIYLQFAGANNSAIIVRKQELIELKADKQPVGIYINEKPFTATNFELQTKDQLYLFSDGFRDQFGGENGEKYKFKRFKNLLLQINTIPIDNQKDIIEAELFKWQNTNKFFEQLDDILIIGIEF